MSQLSWDVFVTPELALVDDDLPPGLSPRTSLPDRRGGCADARLGAHLDTLLNLDARPRHRAEAEMVAVNTVNSARITAIR